MKKHFILILLAACLCHLPFAIDHYPSADSKGYKQYANNVLAYGVYGWSLDEPVQPSAYRVPVYPLFLAAIYAIGGDKDMPVYAAQLLLSALTCLIVYFIAYTLWASRRIAFWAGFVCAFHPILGYLVGTILSETLFTFLLAASVLALVVATTRRSYAWSAAGGMALALATLCRPVTQFLFLFVMVGFFLSLTTWRQRWIMSAMLLAGMAVVIGPWAARNHVSLGRAVLFSDGGTGMAIYLPTRDPAVYHPIRQQDMNVAGKSDKTLKLFLDGLHQYDAEKMSRAEEVMKAEGWTSVRRDPVGYLWRRIKLHPYLWVGSSYLTGRTWGESRGYTQSMLLKSAIILFLHVVPLCAYVLFAWLRRKTWKTWWLPYTIPLYMAMVFLPLHFDFRYSMPAYPYILMFAVAAALSNRKDEASVWTSSHSGA